MRWPRSASPSSSSCKVGLRYIGPQRFGAGAFPYLERSAMNLETWLLFSSAALIVILIPGPLSLLMVSNSLNYGLRRSLPAFLGGVSASICLLSASALGLGALLLASEQLFSTLKIIGALYLFYL